MSAEKNTVRLKVSPEAARLVRKGAPRDEQLQAARGALPLSPRDEGDILFFLAHSSDAEIRLAALETLKNRPTERICSLLMVADRPTSFLELVARFHAGSKKVVAALLDCDGLPPSTLVSVAAKAESDVLEILAQREDLLLGVPDLRSAIKNNPRAGFKLRSYLEELERAQPDALPTGEDAEEGIPGGGDASPEDSDEAELDDEALSKYQKALEMPVSEKIKMALTGDKEWRGIFIKDANKLVSSAVMKNPRISDGEVLAVAKNKSSSDELIRLITLNREWVKNYEIKKALIEHPRTPLPTALRYMNVLTEKDMKGLAKSRGVSQVIVNNARRMLLAKAKK